MINGAINIKPCFLSGSSDAIPLASIVHLLFIAQSALGRDGIAVDPHGVNIIGLL